MSKNKINPVLTTAMLAAVFAAGSVSAGQMPMSSLEQAVNLPDLGVAQKEDGSAYLLAPANSQGQFRYILRFKAPALAMYKGGNGLQAPTRFANGKIDTKGQAAIAYVASLKQQQNLFLSQLSNVLNRPVTPVLQYQNAFNGMAVYLQASEAKSVKSMNGVAALSRDYDQELNTDAGPRIIGADNVWTGTAPATGTALGEGVVIGTLDSGTNFDHSSFADIGGDLYDHTNPLGAGVYLGVCDVNHAQYDATYICNDKLIGGYDFVNGLEPVGATEIPGPEDENGHGSHTSSTSGGNQGMGDISGQMVPISGVAPHATNVIFDVCYEDSLGRGLCPGASSIASVDQAVSDGLVDVINFSIGGGQFPWQDPVSRAFANATEAGIFVATSAGNAGPDAATLGHVEPWTTAVGATTHDRNIETFLNIGASPGLQDIGYLSSADGPGVTVQISAEMRWAGDIDANNVNGCDAWPLGTEFTGEIAFVDIFGCNFSVKVVNATAAGAVAVVVRSNSDVNFFMGGMGATTIPSMTIPLSLANAAVTEMNGGTLLTVINPDAIISYDGQADVMASFSSRGPSAFEYNKPDVAAPGVNILAAFDDDVVAADGVDEYGIISGTSMASPHVAGSAALLRELQPSWTPMELKSALMMTAKNTGNTKEDGVTPTDHWDDGAGRIQVDVASSAGLVMHESAFNMLLADPNNFGDPKTINAPNLTNLSCIDTCSFERSLRSVASIPVTYNASLSGIVGTVNPSQFTVAPGATVTLDIEVNGDALPAGVASFGELNIVSATPGGSFVVNPSLPITDGAYTSPTVGTAGMVCEDIVTSGLDNAAYSSNIVLSASHQDWLADLTVKLLNPAGDVLTLLNESSNGTGITLDASIPISFFDGAAASADTLGSDGGAFGGDPACTTDPCEFFPFANAEATPPATFADLSVGNPNGTWQICAGDSAGGDAGVLESATLNIVQGVAADVPALHMPAVIVGFPNAPEIDVTPTSLSATMDPDMTTDLNLNIANLPSAGADLNWSFSSVLFNGVLAGQAVSGTDGIISDFYAPDNTGVYSADDFTFTGNTSIETMFFGGFVLNQTLEDIATDVTVEIFADNNGIPAGDPEDGLNSALVAFTVPIGDASLDLTDGNISIDVVAANGSAIELPPGTYWVTVYPTNSAAAFATDRWNWFVGTPDDTLAQLNDPSDLFGSGTEWSDLVTLTADDIFAGLNYDLSGEAVCGAPWLSTSSANGVLAPSASEDVTVTLDSAGLSPGVYKANLCLDTDDIDESRVYVGVTLTVDGPSDIIFKNGFEAPAP